MEGGHAGKAGAKVHTVIMERAKAPKAERVRGKEEGA